MGFDFRRFHLRLLTELPFGQPGFRSNEKPTPVLIRLALMMANHGPTTWVRKVTRCHVQALKGCHMDYRPQFGNSSSQTGRRVSKTGKLRYVTG